MSNSGTVESGLIQETEKVLQQELEETEDLVTWMESIKIAGWIVFSIVFWGFVIFLMYSLLNEVVK